MQIAALTNTEEYRAARLRDIRLRTKEIITAGVILKGILFGSTVEDQLNLSDAGTALAMQLVASIKIKPKGSGEPLVFTADDLPELVSSLTLLRSVPMEAGRLLQASIEAAETLSEIEGVTDTRVVKPFSLAAYQANPDTYLTLENN